MATVRIVVFVLATVGMHIIRRAAVLGCRADLHSAQTCGKQLRVLKG